MTTSGSLDGSIGPRPERVVDFHMHLGFSTDYACSPPAHTVATVLAAGFSGAVVFPFERGTQPSYSVANDRILAAARRWRALCPFARVDTRDVPASLEEIARTREAGARGLKIHPLFDKVSPKAADTARVLEALSGSSLPVLVHMNRGENSHPNDWAPLMTELSDVCFVIGHAGFFEWRSALTLACKLPNVYLETSLCTGLILEKVAEFAPLDRVLFGSDHPYGDNRASYETLRRAVLRARPRDSAEALSLVFHANAERLLGRTFTDTPTQPLDAEPPLALPGALRARGSDLARRTCTVYQLSTANCSFVLDDSDGQLPDDAVLDLEIGGRSFEIPIRIAFGHGARRSAYVTSAASDLVEAIVVLHCAHQDDTRSHD